MATVESGFPMFGVYNEHWKNHPAGLPKSLYQGNTNPNQGTQSYQQWAGQQPAQTATPAQATTTTTPATQTPATTTQPTATTAPTTNARFSSRYTPAMMDQAYENPWYVLRDVFSGLDESSPMYQALRDLGGDPLTLFNIQQGSQQKIDKGAGGFVDWLADMYGNMGKVGGTGFNAGQLLGALFGQQRFGADAENTLGQILGAGDMSTQVRTLYNMARDVSNVGMNPLAARGYQSALAQAGDRYGTAMMQTPGTDTSGPQNPASWIAQNMPWLGLE